MRYVLWNDNNLKEIKEDKTYKRLPTLVGRMIIELLREANARHNTAMLKKDAEIEMLQYEIKTLKDRLV